MQAAIMTAMKRMQQAGRSVAEPDRRGRCAATKSASRPRSNFLAYADPEIGRDVRRASTTPRATIVRARTDAKVGWTIAAGALTAAPGGEEKLARDPLRQGGHLLGRQPRRRLRGRAGVLQPAGRRERSRPAPAAPRQHPRRHRLPARLARDGRAARDGGDPAAYPILITENGIATADDTQRIRYTDEALQGLLETIADGIDVRGYLHWSLLDNFEWGHWEPTFGLIAVDRETFERTPKPSLAWLGQVAQRNALPAEVPA